MKDNEFEKLLQESIRLYGHEYPEPPSSDMTEIHRFPENFIDDIVPHAKPKKPFILRHIKALSAAAAVMVIGLAAVMIFSRPNSDKLYKQEGIVAPSNNSISTPEPMTDNNIAVEDSSPTKSTSETEQTDSTDPENSFISDNKYTHPCSNQIEFSNPFEASIVDFHGKSGETSKSTDTKNIDEASKNNEVSDNTETPVNIEESAAEEASGYDVHEYSEEYSNEDMMIEQSELSGINNYIFIYDDNSDDSSNVHSDVNIRSLLNSVSKYMSDRYLIDDNTSYYDIQECYRFIASDQQDLFRYGKDEYYYITVEKTEKGYVVSAMKVQGYYQYFIKKSEDDFETITAELQSIVSGG